MGNQEQSVVFGTGGGSHIADKGQSVRRRGWWFSSLCGLQPKSHVGRMSTYAFDQTSFGLCSHLKSGPVSGRTLFSLLSNSCKLNKNFRK